MQSDRSGRAGPDERQGQLGQERTPQEDVLVDVVVVVFRPWRQPGQAFAIAVVVLVVFVFEQRFAARTGVVGSAPTAAPTAPRRVHHDHGPFEFQAVRIVRGPARRRSGHHGHQPGRDHKARVRRRHRRRSVQQQGERFESQVARGRRDRRQKNALFVHAVVVRRVGGRTDGRRGLPVAAPPTSPPADVAASPTPPSPHGRVDVAADEPILQTRRGGRVVSVAVPRPVLRRLSVDGSFAGERGRQTAPAAAHVVRVGRLPGRLHPVRGRQRAEDVDRGNSRGGRQPSPSVGRVAAPSPLDGGGVRARPTGRAGRGRQPTAVRVLVDGRRPAVVLRQTVRHVRRAAATPAHAHVRPGGRAAAVAAFVPDAAAQPVRRGRGQPVPSVRRGQTPLTVRFPVRVPVLAVGPVPPPGPVAAVFPRGRLLAVRRRRRGRSRPAIGHLAAHLIAAKSCYYFDHKIYV